MLSSICVWSGVHRKSETQFACVVKDENKKIGGMTGVLLMSAEQETLRTKERDLQAAQVR
jgi:hypothetical protein